MPDFDDMFRRCRSLHKDLTEGAADPVTIEAVASLMNDLAALRADERRDRDHQPFRDLLFSKFSKALEDNNIVSGVLAEVGGAMNSFLGRLPQFEHRFLSIFPQPADPRFVVADITNCPHLADSSFDAIFSVSVLEHVTRINDAGTEITRLLKPGGITMHAVPFSYFFHGAPVDYWRVTTTALEAMFEELSTIECTFYNANRRRNNMGSPSNPIDQDGGPLFAPDAFGGWRENWFTIYTGRKTADGAQRLLAKRLNQAMIDIIKGLTESGVSEDDAVRKALALAQHISFNPHGKTLVTAEATPQPGLSVNHDQLKAMWSTRSKLTVRPSVGRWNLMALLQAQGLV